MKEKANKNCCVRLPESLHRAAKVKAYQEGKNLQDWVMEIVAEKLQTKDEWQWLCETCGGWKLKGTQMAKLGKCETCHKEEVAVFLVWEKK